MTRTCGDCQLCCKLLPVRELSKDANTRCQHQKHGKGCGVYGSKAMPMSCKLWNCRWLLNDQTTHLSRPDRAGYVIDVMPDFVTHRNELSGAEIALPVVQVWIDPARPLAWRQDAYFMAYLEAIAITQGLYALVRNGSNAATFVAAPCLNDGEWFFHTSGVAEKTHTPEDFLKVGLSMKVELADE